MDMSKTYNPSEFEKRIYQDWSDKGLFRADIDKNKKPFTIVMPPPNITGQLHMGHALDDSIQDSIIRFRRMQGYSALWLPGTDHASIATEVKIVERMKNEEGLSKTDVGRDGFMERAWAWKNQYGNRIVEQLKELGCSCDWSREAFTMDENCSNAVKHVFVKLYNKGLIYKGKRIINWCPSCKTALSDAEVEYEEEAGHLWHVRYPYADGSGEIIIATTRPETILGDTAVAVNPKDKRYRKIVGKMLILPLSGKEIPVVADDYVEQDFGSGAVKITPAHDPNDFEVGLRHNLEVIRIMNDDGTMNELAGKYCGMTREECRTAIVEDLQAQGYMVKIEDYSHNVGKCYRCSCTVEPIISPQWFVKMQPLATPAVDAAKNGEVEFLPKNFEKTYYNWMENIKDWCISRQLWWGHRIPAYYCQDCGEMIVSESAPTHCSKCKSNNFVQDEDVLDTWFSSALWPFSTLGYPNKTADLQYFYPNNLLVTGYDIIFFWVARMIFSGIEHVDKVPFEKVLFHGLVRDKLGRKMSKSLGNGIDPLEIIRQYGADSLRLSLLMGIAVGGDTRFSEEKVLSNRNFLNKLWNASRFVMMHAENATPTDLHKCALAPADKWILTKLNSVVNEATVAMEKYDLGLACTKISEFMWNDFCDWYIELSKTSLNGDNLNAKNATVAVLEHVLTSVLKLLHPFAPFITEEIYSNIRKDNSSIMVAQWPTVDDKLTFGDDAQEFNKVMDLIRSIRNARAEKDVAPSKKLSIIVDTDNKDNFEKYSAYICKLCNISDIDYSAKFEQDKSVIIVFDLGNVIIPLGELVDFEEEKARLIQELKRAEGEIKRANGMLNNAGFLAKAPQCNIDAEKQKLIDFTELKSKLEQQLKSMA